MKEEEENRRFVQSYTEMMERLKKQPDGTDFRTADWAKLATEFVGAIGAVAVEIKKTRKLPDPPPELEDHPPQGMDGETSDADQEKAQEAASHKIQENQPQGQNAGTADAKQKQALMEQFIESILSDPAGQEALLKRIEELKKGKPLPSPKKK